VSKQDQHDPRIGAVLGQCRMERLLGMGGMGAVYLAHHTGLDMPVAVKILPAMMASRPQWRARFQHEAKLAARIEHPSIVRVLDAGHADQTDYLVMEYIEGAGLDQRLEREGTLAVEEALGIIRQAAQGLARAHKVGLIHRDIKPANLMLTAEGQVKVTDFGLARDEALTTLSVTGQILGTPSFMSPEQANAEPVDRRTDVYSLGVTLFALLEGASPFQRDQPLVSLRATCESPLPPVTRQELPPGLYPLIQKMTAKRADLRYLDMEAVVAGLDGILAQTQLAPEPPRSPQRPRSSRRRAREKAPDRVHPGLFVMGGVALLAAILLFGWLRSGVAPPAVERPPVTVATKKPEPTPPLPAKKKQAPAPLPTKKSDPKPKPPTGPTLADLERTLGELLAKRKTGLFLKTLRKPGVALSKAVSSKWQERIFEQLAQGIADDLKGAKHAQFPDLLTKIHELPTFNRGDLLRRQQALSDNLQRAQLAHKRRLRNQLLQKDWDVALGAAYRLAVETKTLNEGLRAFRALRQDPRFAPFLQGPGKQLFELTVLEAVESSWEAQVTQLRKLGSWVTLRALGRVKILRLVSVRGKRLVEVEFKGSPVTFSPSLAQRARWAHGMLDPALRDLYTGVALWLTGAKAAPETQQYLRRAKGHPLLALYLIQPKKAAPTKRTPKVSGGGHRLRRTFPDAQLRRFVAMRARQPAARQLELTLELLSKLNGFKVILKSRKIVGGKLIDISLGAWQDSTQGFNANHYLVDITPLYGLSLTDLDLSNTMVRDLRPLAGLPLERLHLTGLPALDDLSPLKGIKTLQLLSIDYCAQLRSIDGLRGLTLSYLNMDHSAIEQLAPIRGMPLGEVRFANCRARDFKVLATLKQLDGQKCPQVGLLLKRITLAQYRRALTSPGAPLLKPAQFYIGMYLALTGQLRAARDHHAALMRAERKAGQNWRAHHSEIALYWLNTPPDPTLEQFYRQRSGLATREQKYQRSFEMLAILSGGDQSSHIKYDSKTRTIQFINASQLCDLRPLIGLDIRHLALTRTAVRDLRPIARLRGTLRSLSIIACPLVEDLSPLRRLTLSRLELRMLPLLRDLRPLGKTPSSILKLGAELAKLPR